MTERRTFKVFNPPKYIVNFRTLPMHFECDLMSYQTQQELRKEIISLTDVLPFPNRSLGPLGNADMQVYDRFIQHFKAAPKVTERSDSWKLWV